MMASVICPTANIEHSVRRLESQRGAFRWPRLAIARVCHASATAAALHGVYFLISFALAETISQKESELFLKESDYACRQNHFMKFCRRVLLVPIDIYLVYSI